LEAQLPAKAIFDAGHLAVVGFVVVAEEMENAVEDEDLEFVGEGAAEFFGIAAGGGGGDGDVAEGVGLRGGSPFLNGAV
jgi:hypothetical protein